MSPHLRRQIRLFLFQWHRRSGVAAALIIVLVTLTGIALNHTGLLKLDRNYPQAGWLLWPYDSALVAPEGLLLDGQWWWADGQQLHRNREALYPCHQLLGGASTGTEHLLQCDGQWLWLDASGQLLDSLDPGLFGLTMSARLAASPEGFQIYSANQWQQLDLDMYQLVAMDDAQTPASLELAALPDELSPARNQTISWQRVVLDMHSGRWFGPLGPWIVDLAALALLFLACSGFWIWYSRRR